MKILVIGLGSMGKRRVRDLKKLGCEVVTYDIKDKIPFVEILPPDIDAMVISTPPDQHEGYMPIAIQLGIPVFIEASVLKYVFKNDLIMPSATMRFSKDIIQIKKELNEPYNFSYRCSSWLPDWHPNAPEDYYALKMGAKEMVPFELEWLQWIFGPIKKFACVHRGTEIYQIIMEFKSGVIGHAKIDVITKHAGGGIRVLTIDDKVYHINSTEDMYYREMEHFVKAVKGEVEYHYTVEEDLKVLELLEEIENV